MRIRLLVLLFVCTFTSTCHAQFVVRFVLDHLPSYHKNADPVFIAGSFNGWNPGDPAFQAKNESGYPVITMKLNKGLFQYKFTRGGWNKAEAGPEGHATENRVLELSSDTVIHETIENWSDHFAAKISPSTASKNVSVMDTAFYIPQLNRHRRVWIYLPQGYATSDKRYPVIYMQDGQNLFDERTSAYGEWGIDESLDTMTAQAIIVGVDHGGEKRINEYSPFNLDSIGEGEGDAFADFLARTLKPYVDAHYRTLKKSAHTSIAGSSMGGLISLYAMLKYPKVFGAAGVFSPAFWTSEEWRHLNPKKLKKMKGRIYLYAGQQESDHMVPDMLQVYSQLRAHSKAQVETVIRSGGRHNEATWRAEFPRFYQWLFSDGERR